jgi:hypothetical protein
LGSWDGIIIFFGVGSSRRTLRSITTGTKSKLANPPCSRVRVLDRTPCQPDDHTITCSRAEPKMSCKTPAGAGAVAKPRPSIPVLLGCLNAGESPGSPLRRGGDKCTIELVRVQPGGSVAAGVSRRQPLPRSPRNLRHRAAEQGRAVVHTSSLTVGPAVNVTVPVPPC